MISADEISKKVKKNSGKDTLILYHPPQGGRSDPHSELERVTILFLTVKKDLDIMEDIQHEFEGDKHMQLFTMDCEANELGALN